MRKIKFRVRDTETNRVYQPEEVCRLYFNEGALYGALLWDGALILKLELIEYIGREDKNGKEIYEGDILFRQGDTYFNTFKDEVRWNEDKDAWVVRSILPYEGTIEFICRVETAKLEVIGNIDENPELLQQEVVSRD